MGVESEEELGKEFDRHNVFSDCACVSLSTCKPLLYFPRQVLTPQELRTPEIISLLTSMRSIKCNYKKFDNVGQETMEALREQLNASANHDGNDGKSMAMITTADDVTPKPR